MGKFIGKFKEAFLSGPINKNGITFKNKEDLERYENLKYHIRDIKNVKMGVFGSGFYDFADIPIGDHVITVEACNGYHISLDLPDWFDPYVHNWPSIDVKNELEALDSIQYIIDKINKFENKDYKLEFEGCSE